MLAVGDLSFQQKCFKRIAELKRAGTTMLFISHDLDAVERLCDRVVLLRQGQVVCEGAPNVVIRRYRSEVLSGTFAQEGADHTREHTEAIAIRRVVVKDAQGSATESIQSGQALNVEIEFEAFRKIDRPAFEVALRRLDGVVCHMTRSDGALRSVEGNGAVVLQYPSLPLLTNLYEVSVWAYEQGNPVPLAAREQAVCFQMVSEEGQQGLLHLEHSWLMESIQQPQKASNQPSVL